MVSVLQNTVDCNLLVNKSKDKILNSSHNDGFYLEDSENNSMQRFSLTGKWVSNKT